MTQTPFKELTQDQHIVHYGRTWEPFKPIQKGFADAPGTHLEYWAETVETLIAESHAGEAIRALQGDCKPDVGMRTMPLEEPRCLMSGIRAMKLESFSPSASIASVQGPYSLHWDTIESL